MMVLQKSPLALMKSRGTLGTTEFGYNSVRGRVAYITYIIFYSTSFSIQVSPAAEDRLFSNAAFGEEASRFIGLA